MAKSNLAQRVIAQKKLNGLRCPEKINKNLFSMADKM